MIFYGSWRANNMHSQNAFWDHLCCLKEHNGLRCKMCVFFCPFKGHLLTKLLTQLHNAMHMSESSFNLNLSNLKEKGRPGQVIALLALCSKLRYYDALEMHWHGGLRSGVVVKAPSQVTLLLCPHGYTLRLSNVCVHACSLIKIHTCLHHQASVYSIHDISSGIWLLPRKGTGPIHSISVEWKIHKLLRKDQGFAHMAARFTMIWLLLGESRHMLIQRSNNSCELSEGTLCNLLPHDSWKLKAFELKQFSATHSVQEFISFFFLNHCYVWNVQCV